MEHSEQERISYIKSNFTLKIRENIKTKLLQKQTVIERELLKLNEDEDGLRFVEAIKSYGFDEYLQNMENDVNQENQEQISETESD